MNDFLKQRFKQYFGDEGDTLIKLLEEEPTHGFFVNTCKANKEDVLKLVDFNYLESKFHPNAYYHNNESIGKTKAYELGLIYPQDLESSFSSSLLNLENINLIVDMCAAPGGKTINIMNRFNNALCISNDVSYSRSNELAKNLERLGLTNSIITSKRTNDLANILKGNVDLVILDAPCSGEGMIRKYKEIIDDYSLENIVSLSKLQKNLLEDAYLMMHKDSYLLYSTCTYAFEEDEDQIINILSLHDDLELVPLTCKYNYSKLDGTIKLCPLNNTEGQFISLIHKKGDIEKSKLKFLSPIKSSIVDSFIKDNLLIDNYYLYKSNNNFYMSFNPLYDLGSNVIRSGIYLGELKKDRFEPAHCLYRSNQLTNKFKYVYDLNDNEYLDFIKGYEIKANLTNNYYLISFKGNSLGFGKVSNGIIKNKYPKGLRRNDI